MNKALPESMKNNYVIYARKSSISEDRQSASIEDQHKVLSTLASQMHLSVDRIFSESMSAKEPGRPVFNEMLAYIKEHNIKGIIAWKLNRLSRNPVDTGTLQWLLQTGDIEEIVTPGKIYRVVDNDFVMSTEGSIAQRFIKDLREDTKRGITKKIEAGHAPFKAPYGYRNDTAKAQGQKTVEVHAEEFAIMRELFTLALSGLYSIQQLYDKSLSLGMKQPNGKPVGRSWFYERLTNPLFYTGRFSYQGVIYKGSHERMLSDTEYDAIVSLYSVKESPRVQDGTRAYNGFLKCTCGHWMTGERHKKTYKNGKTQLFVYYRCVHHVGEGKPSFISVPLLETQIRTYLKHTSLKPHYLELYVEWLKLKKDDQKHLRDTKIQTLQRTQKNLTERMDSLFDMFCSPDNRDKALISSEEYLRRKSQLEIDHDKTMDELKHISEQNSEFDTLVFKSFVFATRALEMFDNGTIEDKQAIVKALCGSNPVIKGKELTITLRKPFEAIQRYASQNMMIEPVTRPTITLQSSYNDNPNLVWGG